MHENLRRAVMASVGAAFVIAAMAAIQYTEQIAPRVERMAEHFPATARSDLMVRVGALAALLWR